MSDFNVYKEAKDLFEELLDNYINNGASKKEVREAKKMTMEELLELNDYDFEYLYSYYTGVLFDVIANNLVLIGYCEEVEDEFGESVIKNPMYINEAIYRYIRDEYGSYKKEDFKW